jgi:hypothetical protein
MPAWCGMATTARFFIRRFARDVMRLPHGKVRMSALEWRLKTQDDLFFRYAGRDQPIRSTFFGAIVLNPDLAVLDVDVQYAAVNSFLTVPPDVDQLIMSLDRVDDRFDVDLAIRRFVSAIFPE